MPVREHTRIAVKFDSKAFFNSCALNKNASSSFHVWAVSLQYSPDLNKLLYVYQKSL